jgi:hypothetical protein
MTDIESPEDWAQWLYDWTGTRVAGVSMLAKRIRARDEAIAAPLRKRIEELSQTDSGWPRSYVEAMREIAKALDAPGATAPELSAKIVGGPQTKTATNLVERANARMAWEAATRDNDAGEPIPVGTATQPQAAAKGLPTDGASLLFCEICQWYGVAGECPNCNGDRGLIAVAIALKDWQKLRDQAAQSAIRPAAVSDEELGDELRGYFDVELRDLHMSGPDGRRKAFIELASYALKSIEASTERRATRAQHVYQACLDWEADTGECHFCGYALSGQHEEHCPMVERLP